MGAYLPASSLIIVAMSSTPATLIGGVETPAGATPGHHHHHHHHLHGAGRTIKHLLRPDGRQVHIAKNPDEARRMSQTLRLNEKDDFDLVIHGSPEHVCLQLVLMDDGLGLIRSNQD
jgi:hypothetical protein